MPYKPKILIVDDSPELLYVMSFYLEKNSYEVLAVISKELLESSLKYFHPDLIILDVFFRNSYTGRELCKNIKDSNEFKKIPILLMSSEYENLTDLPECMADEKIHKPFNLSLLMDKIEQLLDKNKVVL